ncbi:Quino protein amine dehydrogenase [Aspergillus karnatakaensis]|uniref:WD40 repeat domain-containing protein n=1 Tax=Aspergillus karnatakaensis TaxID=1810916 RepID=UPI003CCE1D3C
MSRICPTPTPSLDAALGSGTVASPISLSDDGSYVAQINGKDLIVHLNPTSSDFQDVQIVKVKEAGCKFLRFSRSTEDTGKTRRVLCASDSRVLVWNLNPLQQLVEIENIEPGTLNIDFGADENEAIAFHAWNTKLTVFGLDTGRSHIIKSPKFSHQNGFGYRPRTGQLAILLKPETSDLLTIHESRSYELIGREVLPTVDAQGLKWSPDGRWVAIWDTASAGTKVLIFTADGQLFRTYTGLPEADESFDFGVRGVEWSPVDAGSGLSQVLAVGKVDGTVDLLKAKTFSCFSTLSHVFQIDQHPSIWRERYAAGGMSLEYTETSSSFVSSTTNEPTSVPRGVSLIGFNHDGSLLSTMDQTRPNIIWIWSMENSPMLNSVLIHEHAIRQIVWHHSDTQLLVTTASNTLPSVRYWSPYRPPFIVRIPVSKNDIGKYDVKWLYSDKGEPSRFWFGSQDDYVLGCVEHNEEHGAEFQCLNTIAGKVSSGSYGTNMSR